MENKQAVANKNIKKQSNWSKVAICIVSSSLILCVYFLISNPIQRFKEQEYIVETNNHLIRYVESAEVTDGEIVISGWCFYTGVDSERNKVQVLLRNVEDETDTIWLDVEPVVREDVDAYFDCDVNYSHSGFRASKRLKNVLLAGKNYEILIKLTYYTDKVVKNSDKEKVVHEEVIKTVAAHRYLCDGVLAALLPEDEPVQSESAFLNEIFENGQLILYEEKANVYVYQYETKMYWIAEKDFYFEEDGTTYIQFQLDTTRTDRLPEKRQEGGYDWDNIGFCFENNELKHEMTESYRVAVCNIPTEYPITHFWTGYYANSEWVWQVYRTPDISELSK